MKKIISVLLVLMMLAVPFAVTASAENFVPSITYKPAPDVVGEGEDENGVIIGYIYDADGNPIATVYEDCLVITSVEDAPTSVKIPAEAADILLQVFEELSSDTAKLSELSDALNKLVEETMGEGKDADALVIKDLFDVTELCDELKEHLPVDGNVLKLTFDVSVAANEHVFAMTYIDGEWAPVEEIVNNGDGTVTITFEKLCPVSILVPGEADNDTPQTGDTTNDLMWAIIMLGATVLTVVLVAAYRRSRKKSELR